MHYFGTYVVVDFLIDGPDGGVGEEAPTYLIEHLATFTVAKENGIVYPSDGMRRLLQLEKSNGIWSQKMQLRLDVSWVLIMDYETGVRSAFYSRGIMLLKYSCVLPVDQLFLPIKKEWYSRLSNFLFLRSLYV
jgi:hypothetical protein